MSWRCQCLHCYIRSVAGATVVTRLLEQGFEVGASAAVSRERWPLRRRLGARGDRFSVGCPREVGASAAASRERCPLRWRLAAWISASVAVGRCHTEDVLSLQPRPPLHECTSTCAVAASISQPAPAGKTIGLPPSQGTSRRPTAITADFPRPTAITATFVRWLARQ